MTVRDDGLAPSPSDRRAPARPEARDSEFSVALDVLEQVVQEFVEAGRSPTGSQVRIALKERTYGGFDQRRLGFATFRAFLREAAIRGRVVVDEDRPGDVAVRLSGGRSSGSEPVRPIRGDFWRAFVEWQPAELRLYDTNEDRVHRLPRDPAPLEPEQFANIRRRLAEAPGAFIEISPVARNQQLDWMREFARSGPEALRSVLEESLAGEKPAKTFAQVLRALPEERSRWNLILTARVRGVVEEWCAIHAIAPSIDKRFETRVEGKYREIAELAGGSASRGEVARGIAAPALEGASPALSGQAAALTALAAFVRTSTAVRGGRTVIRVRHGTDRSSATEDELRLRIHAAVDRMPAEELRQLVIPVGYLFEV